MKQPNPLFCFAVFMARFFFMLIAPVAVAVGMLTRQIKPGQDRVLGQWGGAYWVNGEQKLGRLVFPIESTGWFSIYSMPDEPGLGLYEKTVSGIYDSWGWYVTVYYQLALRNIAQGWSYQWAVHGPYVPAPERTWTIFGLRYGYKQYEDWKGYSQAEVLANAFAERKFYCVPDFFVSAEDAA